MRYQVPQFIEIEDKIFGPLTAKQFIYLAGAGGLFVAIYTFYGLFIAIVLSLPVVGLAVALAFFRVNDRPFVSVLESAFYFYTRRKIFLWKKHEAVAGTTPKKQAAPSEGVAPYVPKLSESRLKDIAWSLDIRERLDGGASGDSSNQ